MISSKPAIDFPTMCDPDNEHNHFAIQYGVHNHVIPAGMDSAEFRMPFQLQCLFPIGIFSEQIKPTRNPLSHLFGQVSKLSLSAIGELD